MIECTLPVLEIANLVSACNKDIGELINHIEVLLSEEASDFRSRQVGWISGTPSIGRFRGDIEKELSPKMRDLGVNSTHLSLIVFHVDLHI